MNNPATVDHEPPRSTVPATQGSAAMAESERAVAEVKAAMMLAVQFPRNVDVAIDEIQRECKRIQLAEVAAYEYAKGGTFITGPSIRLMEQMAMSWRNVHSGWRELGRRTINGQLHAEIEAWAWDVERNNRVPANFIVKLWRDTKGGGYPLKDERDIYELCANMAARRKRSCLQAIVPGYLIEMALGICDDTLEATIKPETTARMLAAFHENYGVTQQHIEKFTQRDVAMITPRQVVRLRKIYNSIKDGVARVDEFFKDARPPAPQGPEPDAPKGGNAAVKDKLAKAVKLTHGPQHDAAVAVGLENQNAATATLTDFDPQTGEVFDDGRLTPEEEAKYAAAEAEKIAPDAPEPTFSLKSYDLAVAASSKLAADHMLAHLGQVKTSIDRQRYFDAWGGGILIPVLGRHALGSMKERFLALGIKV